MGPKAFISYCGEDRAIAQRLKKDLEHAGCDPWQFDLSAVPGTDAWSAILDRIEKSDFLIVVLSKAATTSKAVQEEISHAHYCSINDPDGRPRMVPLIVESGVTPPPQIIRSVRLPFRESHYNDDFGHLLRSLGLEESPFAHATDLDFTFSRERPFDVPQEASAYASNLIHHHPDVTFEFEALKKRIDASSGLRWLRPAPQVLILDEHTYRSRIPEFHLTTTYLMLVVYLLHSKHTKGYATYGKIAVQISAVDVQEYGNLGERADLILKKETLRLTYQGFRELASSPIAVH
jgi:TIR domain-containing protein